MKHQFSSVLDLLSSFQNCRVPNSTPHSLFPAGPFSLRVAAAREEKFTGAISWIGHHFRP